MEIKIIRKKVNNDELKEFAKKTFGEMVKAVVDIEKEIIAIGGELHADGNEKLLEEGSKQKNLWGINIYPGKSKDERIEFSALINIRPLLGNRSMEIQIPEIREKIKKIIDKLIL